MAEIEVLSRCYVTADAMKRPASDMQEEHVLEEQPSKKPRIDESIYMDSRFLIQSRNAGAIIGKGGQNINRLRNDFKASVSVPDCPGPERVLTLGGCINVIGQMLMDIIPRLDDYSHHNGLDFKCEMRLLVHQSHAGSLIGRAGFKIKELRERTGANIKIYSSCCPNSTDRVVQVSGTPEIVVDCVKDILDSISKAPVKLPNNCYDPHDFDDQYANEYGGYGGMNDNFRGQRGGGGGSGGRGRRQNSGGGGSRGRSGVSGGGSSGWGGRSDYGSQMNDYEGSGDWNDYDNGDGMSPRMNRGGGANRQRGGRSYGGDNYGRNSGGNNRMGGSRGGRGRSDSGGSMYNRSSNGSNMGSRGGRMGGSQMGQRMSDDMMDMGNNSGMAPQIQGNMQQNFADNYRNQGSSNQGPVNTTQVSVPKDIAGAIIGKGGSRIKGVRVDSGATVTIAEALPGSNDRIITISGSDDQIQRAQFLLQKCVKENSGPSMDGNSYMS